MSKILSWQEKNQRRTKRHEKAILSQSLIVPVSSYEEREYVRSHLWYSAAGDDYIASFMSALPLACAVLTKLRGSTTFSLVQKGGAYELRTPLILGGL